MHQPFEPCPRRPAPGVGLTLWTGGNLAAALTPATRSLLAEARPDVVCVHAGPDRLAGAAARLAGDVRRLVPGVRLMLGLGWDWWLERAIRGQVPLGRAVRELTDAGDLAAALGCEAVIHDAEAACKLNSRVTALAAREVIGAIRAEHPDLIQGHTAYDHPTLHSDDRDGDYDDDHVVDEYAWRAYCGPGGVDWEIEQNYCAPKQPKPPAPPVFAAPGALRRRFASSERSWRRTEALGWVRADLPHDSYLQAHHVPFAQTVTMGCERDVVLLWCGPELAKGGRMDESGAWALRGLCALDREGFRRPGGIGDLERARGLAVDVPHPIAGRQVLRAVGVSVPAGVV